MTSKMIYVSIVGHQIAASETQDVAIASAFEMIHTELQNHIQDAFSEGESRKSVGIRTAYLELRK